MKKLIWIVILLVIVGAGGAWIYANRGDKEPTVTTLKISRGDIVDGVQATGTLQAVTTVTVGTQVSGIVQDLYVDFNSFVKKGQVIARLDPSLLQTQVETAKANLVNAQANLERQKVSLTDAENKLARAKELDKRQLINKVDLETADVTQKQAEAQLKSTESQIVQAQAALNKAEVDLGHTVITAPIDGIVIKRSVDKGQTVNAGMSAPELFIIAADLTKMQVNANIDESDVGRMRQGQAVTFRVDAYPNDTFHGTVKQVRLNPTTVQNVVTYSTVIDVPNPDFRLKPGMTANVNIEIARRSNVLRVPNAAIRFRPTKDIFDALKQPMPAELERGFGRGRGQNAQGGPGAAASGSGAPAGDASAAAANTAAAGTTGRPAQANGQNNQSRPNRQGSGQQGQQNAQNSAGQGGRGNGQGMGGGRGGNFGNMTPEEREKRRQEMQDRLAKMTPEERAAWEKQRQERMANGGGRGGFGGGQGQGQGGQPGSNARNENQGSIRGQKVGEVASKKPTVGTPETIDALFGPLPSVETRGRAWLYINKQLKPISLRLGISDGTNTEILNDTELQDGVEVVTSVITPEMAARPTNQQNNANNPLMPQRGRGPGGPGGGGRGGGR